LKNLAQHLETERVELLGELEGVGKRADHIKHIVAVQQEFAGVSNFSQPTHVAQLVEDAIRICTLERQGAEIIREFAPLPPVLLNKHKLLQILINLLSNAKHAVHHEQVSGPRRISVRTGQPGPGRLVILVMDNGVGILSEDLERIFQHGFTTRKDGHGFGLHGSITAARELGGSLTASSPGRGLGATFTLELPCEAVATEAAQ
jgi:signal transduction histidine kinase